MWKINWKLVSALVIIGGIISFFVYPGQRTAIAIIFIIALFITAYMSDESEIRAEAREKELIKKYYNLYGNRLLESDELRKKLAKEMGFPINQRQMNILTMKIWEYKWSLEDKK